VPEGGDARRRAERVVAFTRAAGRSEAAPVEVGPGEARSEFESESRARAAGALEDLLVHHLLAHHGGSSFLPLPSARAGVQAAWEVLATLRESWASLPGVPGPGEAALEVAGRLLGGLYQLGWDEAVLELWRARLEHAGGGARAGERAFRERLAKIPARGRGSRTFAELLAGLAASLLDRGALRDVKALFEEYRGESFLQDDCALRRLRSWTRLLDGDLAGAASARAGDTAREEPLPRALVELHDDWPAARPLLGRCEPTRLAQAPADATPHGAPLRSRADLGASVLAVFAFGPGRGVETLHVDAAPALRARLERWLREREGACCVRTQPEHALVIEARPQRRHGPGPPSSLGRRACAVALTPVLDEEGEVAGWLHFEFEHHLVPERARLARVAASWQLPILRRAGSFSARGLQRSDRVSEARAGVESWAPPNAAARLGLELEGAAGRLGSEVFRALVESMGLKLRQRRWWAFSHGRGETRFVAGGGEGLEGALETPGGARGLDRCLATGGVVAFEGPDLRLSIHAESASGFVLPLCEGGRVVALFAMESSRRRDFKSLDLDGLARQAAEFALPLTMARFRAWHLEQFGFDLFFDTAQPAFREFSQRVFVAARSHSPLVLSGPVGAGKGVIARWVHWCAGGDQHGLEVFQAEFDGGDEERTRQLVERLRLPRGRHQIDGVAYLSPELQEELLRALEGPGVRTGSRPIVTTTTSLADCVERGRLRSDLAARLDRFQVFVPGLADRRRDVPGLARFFAARFAAEEGCVPPRFDDAALALLWRQAWRGNLRELEALVFKLVVLHPGEEIGPPALRAMARRFKLSLADRLPRRRPRRSDLVQAVRSTLTSTGRCNKRRAAAYLGWDPDTLVARLREAGLDLERLAEEPDSWVG
jgi:hypothetical protein